MCNVLCVVHLNTNNILKMYAGTVYESLRNRWGVMHRWRWGQFLVVYTVQEHDPYVNRKLFVYLFDVSV